MFKEINKCRISNGLHLTSVLNLGDQYLTGVFPKSKKEKVKKKSKKSKRKTTHRPRNRKANGK